MSQPQLIPEAMYPAAARKPAFGLDSTPHVPPVTSFLHREFEQDEDFALMARLNNNLQQQFGEEFYLQSFSGSKIQQIPRSTLFSLARCYAEVFNESWGEDWTTESALEEILQCMNCGAEYFPIMTLLFREERVIGFSWAFLLDRDMLTEDSAPFSSSTIKRHESVEVARYWMEEVAKKKRLVSIRELGVIKEFRNEKAPYLMLPIFEKVGSMDCNVAFFRTKITSAAFKWSLGVGFLPLQLFMVDGLLLMKGNIRYAKSLVYGSIDQKNKRRAQATIITNIKRYLCD